MAQVGTFALVPQVAEAVDLPAVAAGGIGDGRGVAAAFAPGTAAVQVGTDDLLRPESGISAVNRAALGTARDDDTALTNVFTGRSARALADRALRELGPLAAAPTFPRAARALQPLRAAAEARGLGDFTPLWSGQAAALARDEVGAAGLTRILAEAVPGRGR